MGKLKIFSPNHRLVVVVVIVVVYYLTSSATDFQTFIFRTNCQIQQDDFGGVFFSALLRRSQYSHHSSMIILVQFAYFSGSRPHKQTVRLGVMVSVSNQTRRASVSVAGWSPDDADGGCGCVVIILSFNFLCVVHVFCLHTRPYLKALMFVPFCISTALH